MKRKGVIPHEEIVMFVVGAILALVLIIAMEDAIMDAVVNSIKAAFS